MPPLIELRDIHKAYATADGEAVPVLHGVSLSIQAGEFVAIMGASGSGKSTLMNLIGCLDRPTSGSYRFDGRDVAALDRDELSRLRREAFGFVFQSYNLIGTATAAENVEIPAVYAGQPVLQRRQRARELLARLGLADRCDHRPGQLSGGQQQRVSIARALMNGGHVILADEPTGALDSKSGAEVMALLKQLAEQGHTVILITHDREVAAHAQRLIEVRDGRVIHDSGALPGQPAAALLQQKPTAAAQNVFWSDTVEILKMALRALRVNLFRTVLTLLGIIIGVASVVAMLAIGNGAKQEVMQSISQMGTNLLLVRPGTPGRRGDAVNATLAQADVQALAQLPNVREAVPENNGNATARYGNIDASTQVTATSAAYPVARNWPVRHGSFFNDDDEASYATVAVLGQTVRHTLFPDGSDPVGRFVLLKNVPFLVIGVMSPKGATPWGQDSDDVVFVPMSTGNLRLFGQSHLRSITVVVDDLSRLDETEQAVTDVLQTRHVGQQFQVRNTAAIVETATEAQNTLTVLLGSIAAISLLVGGIGVMNIMLVSVTERTREIGIRMATGARTRHILQQFLTEAVLVSVLGGSLGVVLGFLAGFAVQALSMPVVFSLPSVVLAFVCAVGTGLVFGFAPAWKASRLDPVVALASE